MEENQLVQTASENVIPYLVHFGDMGVSPRVLRLDGENIAFVERCEGPRLGNYIPFASEAELNVAIYSLGKKIAYANKHGVFHGDFTTDNVIVKEGNGPVIIDWDGASLGGVFESDIDYFFSSMDQELRDMRFEEWMKEAYGREIKIKRKFTDQQIMEKYYRMLENFHITGLL